ncbi:MAG: NusG domain II-containing protein [Arenicellales bacterium]
MVKMKAGDWLILFLCLLLVPLSWSMTKGDSGVIAAVEITVGDQPAVVYPIKVRQQITVAGDLGDSVIEIRDARVRMISSPCNGKICILGGWHQHNGDNIVCLPNKVGVSLISNQERFDGINF